MTDTSDFVTFRSYRLADYEAVASLWTRINRELAPIGLEKLIEQYIAASIDGELKQLADVFSEAKRNAFWVVESANGIIGTFGIESRNLTDTELRRMYLDREYRGSDIAQRMLDFAEARARARIHENDSEHSPDPASRRQILSKERVLPDPVGSGRGDDDQAGGGWPHPFSLREGALIQRGSLCGHGEHADFRCESRLLASR